MKLFLNFVILVSILSVSCNKGCSKSLTSQQKAPSAIGQQEAALGIETVPTSLGDDYVDSFNRYTKIVAPNGQSIHILAQTQITNEQIVRARNVLEHYLTNLTGSLYGSDKSAIANKMAENEAILLLLNGSDDGTNSASNLGGQPLYQNEIQVEGHRWYINQNYEHRDATFEEILHLVHDTGIGVDQNPNFAGALPEFQTEIRAAQQNALSANLWGMGQAGWISELTQENSLSQEYLAAVIDSYYGLWGAWEENSTHGMWGIYLPKTRDEISTEDPMGSALMNNKFFHSYLTYNARIDASFEGTFSLKFDQNLSYTHHSQYLKKITLTGNKNSNAKVNKFDNQITGNAGINTVIFSGNSYEYTINQNNPEVVVSDNQIQRDRANTLIGIEKLQFLDQIIEL